MENEMSIKQLYQRIQDLEAKIEASNRIQNNFELESRLRRIESNIGDLKTSIAGPNGPWYHKMADSVNSVVGFREAVVNTHLFIKYIWALLFTAGVILTVFFLVSTAQEYLADPTATKAKITDNSTYSFPSIVLCPIAWFDTDKAVSLGLSLDGLKYSLGYYTPLPSDSQMKNLQDAKTNFDTIYTSKNFSSLLQFYESISIDFPTVHSDSEFRSLPSALKFEDRNSTYVKKIIRDTGVCFLYSIAHADITRSISTTSAKWIDKSRNILGESSGWWFEASMYGLNSATNTNPNVYLAPFTRSSILLTARRFIALNKPSSQCNESSDDAYSAFACIAECRNQFFKDYLKCEIFQYSRAVDDPASGIRRPGNYCHQIEKLQSRNQTLQEFRFSDESAQLNTKAKTECVKRCPRRCDKILHQTNIQWQQEIFNYKKGNQNESYFEFVLEHNSVFEGGMLVFTELSTYSFTELLNNVGGTLGLFVGGTMMTLAQLILFFLSYLIDKKQRKTTVKTVNTLTEPNEKFN